MSGVRGQGAEGFTLVELPAVSKRERSAFTLVELLVVIAIIGLLMGLILGVSSYAGRKADRSRAIAQMQHWMNALDEYRVVAGAYPNYSAETGVNIMWTSFVNRVSGQFTNVLSTVDPWGRVYYYQREAGGLQYVLKSLGPDSLDNSDDIVSTKGEF